MTQMEGLMRQPSRFWDRIADRYAKQPVSDEAAYQKKLAITREYLRPEMELLEFGCGTGSTALVHAPFVKHIQAIDISKRMIEIAQVKAETGGIDNVSFDQNTIEALEAADGRFDMILGLSILHLLEDKEAAIAKVRRLLKPGGLFVSSTACIGETMGWFRLVAPLGSLLGLIPLVRIFTQAELEASLTAAGFTIERRFAKGMTLFVVARKPG